MVTGQNFMMEEGKEFGFVNEFLLVEDFVD
jgi:hypothetical protein